MSRTLETILTGTNRLSPVLREAAQDVERFRDTVEGSNRRSAESSSSSAAAQERAVDRVSRANSRLRQSHEETARQVEASNRQTQQAVGETREQVQRDTGDIARQLATTRASLVDLGRNKVRPGIDTTEARVQLTQLRAQLDAVAGSNPSARVQAETEAARAQLRVVQAQLNAIDGQTVTAHVDVDDRGSAQRSTSNMRTLTAVALGVSPALTSIGAVAVAGLGTIGPLAVSGAAGLGVLALGLAGVADTTKLLGQRQEQVALEAGKSAGAGAASAASQASAARQIQSAEASLANTRANAADSAVRAAEQVTDAQRGVARAEQQAAAEIEQALDAQVDAEQDLTRAQRDQQQAQNDLTAARKTAQQQIEDLTGNVADNALSQRQSVLDVADAKRALDNVLANPGASDRQREQAEVNYQQQVRRQESLAITGRRLADQQADAAARGVEGSVVVTAAQERLVDANSRVADSSRAIGDAVQEVDRARVDGAQRVADAQDQVTEAVRDQASEARQAAFSIAQGQAGVASAMAASAAATAGAGAGISDTLARIDQQLAEVNPHTLAFAGYIQDRLKPAWEQLKDTAAGGLLPGVQQSIENLMPYFPELDGFVGGLASTLGDLAVEGSEALTGPFWRDFFRMIENNADPILTTFVHTLGNTATGFAGIITAFMPMARDVGDGIEDLSADFARWGAELADSEGFRQFTAYVQENWPRIRELVSNVADVVGNLVEAGLPIGSAYLQAFVLLSDVLSGLPVGVVQALLVTLLGYKALTSVTSIIGGVTGALDRLGGSAQTAGRHADTSVGGLGRMSGAASGLMGVLGGPWGIALAGAGLVIAGVTAKMEEATQQTDTWARALAAGGGAADAARAQMEAHESRGNDNWFGRATRSMDEWLGLQPSVDEATSSARAMWDAMTPLQQSQAKVAEWSDILNTRLNTQGTSTRDVTAAQDRLAYWSGEVGRQQGQLEGATAGTNLMLAEQVRTLADLTGAHVSIAGAQSDFYEAVARADGALEGLSGQVLDSAGNLDVQSESGRRAQDVLFGVRDSANQLIDSMVTQGATTEEVIAKDAELREGFIKSAEQMGISREAAEKLADQIYGIPSERTTTITANTAEATNAVAALQLAIDQLKGRVVSIQARATMEDLNGAASGNGQMGTFAEGGYTGHGGKYEKAGDVHRGEVVFSQEDVAAHGGPDRVDMLRRSRTRGYADGGIVIEPTLDTDQYTQDMEILANQVAKRARTVIDTGGILGSGSVAGGWRGLFAAVKSVIPEARINSTYRPGDPGYHGKDMAIDFGFGSGPGGAGSAGLASINRLIHDRFGANMLELIYDGYGDDRPDLKNMKPHTYNAGTRAEHHNHVHAVPREFGGPVQPGQDYLVGERGREIVTFDRPGMVTPNDQATRLLTPAGMPGYGPAGTGGGYTPQELGRALAQALSDRPTGPLLNIEDFHDAPEAVRDLAQELNYVLRTGG